MSFLNKLKKISKAKTILSGIALGSALATINIASQHQDESASDFVPKNRIEMRQNNKDFIGFQSLFEIQGKTSEIESTQKALIKLYQTPEGQKLFDDLKQFKHPFQISVTDSLEYGTYANTNPKERGYPIQINQQIISNDNHLATTLFHELCHVRQYSEGVGRISDTREERYDCDLANETEARLTTSLMSFHLPNLNNTSVSDNITSENWMDSAMVLDKEVYTALKKEIGSSDTSKSDVDKLVKKEMVHAILSGKNTDLINQVLKSEKAYQYEVLNQAWLDSYTVQAMGHAYDDFYPTMNAQSLTAERLLESVSKRMNLDKTDLLSPTGTELTNIKRDHSGHILSCGRKQRGTGCDLGNIACTYDLKGRPVFVTEYNPDQSIKTQTHYEYGKNYLPATITEIANGKTSMVSFDEQGKRMQENIKDQKSETIISYKDGHKSHETYKHEFGFSETEYDSAGHPIDYIHKTNDGTIIDEYHSPQKSTFLKQTMDLYKKNDSR